MSETAFSENTETHIPKFHQPGDVDSWILALRRPEYYPFPRCCTGDEVLDSSPVLQTRNQLYMQNESVGR